MATRPPLLSSVPRLLAGEAITDAHPWSAGERAVDALVKATLADLARAGLANFTEFNHYGSGYASYYDAFLYPADGSTTSRSGSERAYTGVALLLSRLSRFCAVMAGRKTRGDRGTGSSYLPDFAAVRAGVAGVGWWDRAPAVLERHGWILLTPTELEPELPADTEVPTILSSPPFRLFDALFHWED